MSKIKARIIQDKNCSTTYNKQYEQRKTIRN